MQHRETPLGVYQSQFSFWVMTMGRFLAGNRNGPLKFSPQRRWGLGGERPVKNIVASA